MGHRVKVVTVVAATRARGLCYNMVHSPCGSRPRLPGHGIIFKDIILVS